MSQDGKLKGKTALITGASRGIGLAVARAYTREGAHVILVSRTRGGLEEADDAIRAEIQAANGGETGDDGGATLIPLNFTKPERIDALGPTLYERFPHIDILVGNAGTLGPLSPLDHIRDQDWQNVMDVNLNANWRLIRTIDPLLKRADAGRAIFVTSGASSGDHAYWGPYAVSKAGLETLVKTYAAEVNNTPVRANLIDPGIVATRMRSKAFPGEDPTKLTQPDDITDLFVRLASPELTDNGRIFKYQS